MIRLNIPKSSGIYKIESIINGKLYIGSAINLKNRKYIHFRDLREKKHHSLYLQRHYNKYGERDLIFSVVELCPKENCIEREQWYLDNWQTGFNICKIAGSPLGVKRKEETIQKMKDNHADVSGEKHPNFGKHGKKGKKYKKEGEYKVGKTIEEKREYNHKQYRKTHPPYIKKIKIPFVKKTEEECVQLRKEYYQKNKDKYRDINKKYRQKNKGYAKKYYQKNEEKIKEYQKNYRESHKKFK